MGSEMCIRDSINTDKSYVEGRKHNFQKFKSLQGVSSKPAEILDDDCIDLPAFDILKQFIKSGTVE